jgi:ribose/xylose/arabinose/galactoside ABC-type transport system permease subunit
MKTNGTTVVWSLGQRIFKARESMILVVFILFCALLGIVAPNFLTVRNITNVVRQFSMITIVAVGMTFVIITGGIDLSVGGIVAFVGVSTAWLMVAEHLPIWVAISAGILMGVLVGFVNGILIVKIGLPPFIATLGMMQVSRGLVLALTKGYPIQPFPQRFLDIGQGALWFIPTPILIMLAVVVVAHVFLSKTTVGRYIYYVGSNPVAANLSGINVKRILFTVYVLAGLASGIAAVILVARLSSAQSSMALGWELDAIAAVVIGGASLSGGEGSIPGTLIGAAMMGVIRNALILLHVSVYWQNVVIGLVIIAAVTFDRLRQQRQVGRG